MRNNYLSKLITLRPFDRVGQHATYDGRNNTANCLFAFNKPVECASECQIGLRSAFIPVTFKNVILGYNDRFILQLYPTTSSGDSDCVFVTVQIPQGQYDTTTALASAVNTVLGNLNTTCAITDEGGGVLNSYNIADTSAILSGAGLTCTVDSTALNKNHLKFTIPSGVKFASSTIKTKDGGANGNSASLLGMQVLFGLPDNGGAGGNEVVGAKSEGRTAHKLIGFGHELTLPIVHSGVNMYFPYPNPLQARTGTAEYSFSSPTIASVLYTPYIYIRCSLVTDSIETVPQGSKMSNILGKIPVTSSGYGDAIFLEPSSDTLFFTLAPGSIQNIQLTLTDQNGRELALIESDWEISLVIRGNIYS